MTLKRTGAPHEPPHYDNPTVIALRAVASGTADEGQQKRAWDWIIYHAAGYMDLSYRPGGEDGRRASDFMEGRRFVGAQMLKLLQPAALVHAKETEVAAEPPPKRIVKRKAKDKT